MFTRQLSKLLYDQSKDGGTIDVNQDGVIDFDELANAAKEIGGIVYNQIGGLVYLENSGGPVLFTLDMWTPFSQKSPGFNAVISGTPVINKPLPWLMLLLD